MTMNYKILTDYVFPPIPIRDFDWQACLEGMQESGPYGSGRTEQEAIDELRELLLEREIEI